MRFDIVNFNVEFLFSCYDSGYVKHRYHRLSYNIRQVTRISLNIEIIIHEIRSQNNYAYQIAQSGA